MAGEVEEANPGGLSSAVYKGAVDAAAISAVSNKNDSELLLASFMPITHFPHRFSLRSFHEQKSLITST
jgi:hypothetical protein